MSLVFSAITPHTPLLVPTIGKENIKKIEATQQAYLKLASLLKKHQPDTILVISPHGKINQKNFTFNLYPDFTANFQKFGDFSLKLAWPGDVGMTYKIREHLETKTPIQLISAPELDYGISVPLFMLAPLTGTKIIPLYYSGLSNKDHFEFGRFLKKELLISRHRIAVIASGELSHRLSEKSPAGYSPLAKKFDKKIINLLTNKKNQAILELDQNLIDEASECGLKSILILLGILNNIEYEPRLMSYESPFGIGYLVMNMEL